MKRCMLRRIQSGINLVSFTRIPPPPSQPPPKRSAGARHSARMARCRRLSWRPRASGRRRQRGQSSPVRGPPSTRRRPRLSALVGQAGPPPSQAPRRKGKPGKRHRASPLLGKTKAPESDSSEAVLGLIGWPCAQGEAKKTTTQPEAQP